MRFAFAVLALAAAFLSGTARAGVEGSVLEKPFDVESGVIEMKKSVTNPAVTTETTETLYFKDFGRVQARHSVEKISGKYVKQAQVTRKFSLLEGTTLTTVDLDKNEGTRMENPAAAMQSGMTRGETQRFADKLGTATNTSSKKVGEEQVAGKLCDVHESVTELGGVKQTTRMHMWKNIVLKLVSSGMGTEVTEEAVSVKTEGSIAVEKFKIPEGTKIADIGNPLQRLGKPAKSKTK